MESALLNHEDTGICRIDPCKNISCEAQGYTQCTSFTELIFFHLCARYFAGLRKIAMNGRQGPCLFELTFSPGKKQTINK